MYGGLDDKSKDLSTIFYNEFTKRNMENKWGRYFEKGESSLENRLFAKKTQVHKRKNLRSEPSMVDLVEYGDLEIEKKIEDGDDEEETQEDRNKAIEWTEDDQKNLMYLGISEMERNKRLESLMARRKEKKLFKGKFEKGLNDKKPIAPLFIKRNNPLNSSKEFDDGLESPGSAPSLIPRSPYSIPFDPSKEKLNLIRDSFPQEFSSQSNMPLSRHESFSLGHPFTFETKQDHGAREHYFHNRGRKYSDRVTYSRFRRSHTDKGTHDWLIDQLIYNESGESSENGENGLQTFNPSMKGEESTHKEDEKHNIDMNDMKDEKVEYETKVMSNQTNESRPEKSGQWPKFPKSHGRVLNLPSSTSNTSATSSNINEVMYENITSVIDKRQENMFLTNGRLCHTPTHSVASDLQVEVSEIGSPTSTVGENAEINSSIDRDSVLYDGDIDRDISSGSEELWGASYHGVKEVEGVKNEENDVEVNNSSRGFVSTFDTCHIDGENTTDICSSSSKYDVPENTPTHATNNHHNIFDYLKHPMEESQAPQSSNSSHALDQFPNETQPENLKEQYNITENVANETRLINDMNNLATTNQDNIENSRNSEDHDTSIMRQESVDDASIYSVSSSPRSVLPEKTMGDEISLSNFDQHIYIDGQQSIGEDLTQESLDNEISPNIILHTRQPMAEDVIDEISLSNFDQHMHIDDRQSMADGLTQASLDSENPPNIVPHTKQPMINNVRDETSFSNFDQHMHINGQQSIGEGLTQESLDSENSPNIVPHTRQPIIEDIIDETLLSNFDQHMHVEPQLSIVDGMIQESSNNHSPHDSMPQTMQPMMDDLIDEISSSNFDQHIQIEPQQSIVDGVNEESLNNEGLHDVMSKSMQPMMDGLINDILLSNFDGLVRTEPQQSTTESVTLETSTIESPPNIFPQTDQLMIDDTSDNLHNLNFNQSQEQTSPLENFNEESNIFGNMNDEVNNKEKHIKLKNNEDNSNHLISQEATIQSTNPISDTTTLEDMNEKSRDSVDDKVSSTDMLKDDKNDNPSSSNNVHGELSKQRVTKRRTQSRESGYLSDVFD
ncbi:GATA zinc finger domain-containing protein 14-like [Vigna radiata var. radiata]|uniref:GATA zinc finger domain-containing protein 14-like n=1 Tax=Vigna radiata var. radiata TaxID=3916 RepID=A0A3Q0FJW4_VIGRR|nr:GATA zinc finger domain-containing protein 14-like [Vigna radiata var. radiata]